MPVFNEERWLDTIFERILSRPEVAQVVAVDDGSWDGSWKKLQHWAQAEGRVQIIQHEKNRGKGAAIHTALRPITAPLVLIQDADLEYNPDDYPKLLRPVTNDAADVVYGSRFLGRVDGNPRWHTLGNWGLARVARALTGLPLTDEATCYKLFRSDVIKRMQLEEEGFGFCPEITARVAKGVKAGRIRFAEVAIGYRGRGRRQGKKIRLRDGLYALACLWRYR